jgi:uncharacterized membrane protein YesL
VPAEQMKPLDITEKVWLVAQEASYVLITSVLWLVCSLPIVTIGASTAAAYALLIGHVAQGNREMARPFFVAFKAKFVRATLLWLMLAVCLAAFGFNAYYYLWRREASFTSGVLAISQVALLGLAISIFTYIFAETIDSSDGIWGSVREALNLSGQHWLASLVIVVVTVAIPGALLWLKLWQFAIFTFGALFYVNTRILVRAARRPLPSPLEQSQGT